MSGAPAFSPAVRAAQSFALLLAVVPFCGPAVAAIPGGSGGPVRPRHRGPACCKRLSAWRPPLVRALCPPGVVWLRRLVPRKKAARHSFPPRKPPLPAPVRCGHAKATPGQAAVPQSAVPSLANSLPPAPADPAPWPRHAAGGVLAAPRHGVPETDLVESGMTGGGGGAMVSGRENARRESWVNMLLNK